MSTEEITIITPQTSSDKKKAYMRNYMRTKYQANKTETSRTLRAKEKQKVSENEEKLLGAYLGHYLKLKEMKEYLKINCPQAIPYYILSEF